MFISELNSSNWVTSITSNLSYMYHSRSEMNGVWLLTCWPFVIILKVFNCLILFHDSVLFCNLIFVGFHHVSILPFFLLIMNIVAGSLQRFPKCFWMALWTVLQQSFLLWREISWFFRHLFLLLSMRKFQFYHYKN